MLCLERQHNLLVPSAVDEAFLEMRVYPTLPSYVSRITSAQFDCVVTVSSEAEDRTFQNGTRGRSGWILCL